MDGNPILFILVAIPVVAALLMMIVPSVYKEYIRWIATVAALPVCIISIVLFILYDYEKGGFQFDMRWHWLSDVAFFGENGITLHLGLDGIAAPLVLLTGIVLLAGTLISWKIEYRNKDFFIMFLLMVSGVFGVFVAQDLFFFFFFYEVAVIPMYPLIAIWGSSTDFGTFTRTKEYGAMKLVMVLVAGSVLVFVAIFATFVEAGQGTFDLAVLGQATYSENFQRVFFPLFMIGFGVLAGMWPFHTWSPDGHVAAPTAVSMIHAGVLMKLGAFGILRIGMTLFPDGAQFWAPALMVLGTTGCLYGAFSAMAQRDFKYMIGYSSVSHMGLVLMGLATLNNVGMNGAVLQMFAHGVMTALMFSMVGVIYDQAHLRDMRLFEGLFQKMPRFAAFFTIAGLSSLGLPGLAGFVAEFNIFVGTFRTYPLFGALGIFAAAVTAAYILRMLAMAFFGPFNNRWAGLKDMSRMELVAGAMLVLSILVMGMWPDPFLDRIAPSVLNLPVIS